MCRMALSWATALTMASTIATCRTFIPSLFPHRMPERIPQIVKPCRRMSHRWRDPSLLVLCPLAGKCSTTSHTTVPDAFQAHDRDWDRMVSGRDKLPHHRVRPLSAARHVSLPLGIGSSSPPDGKALAQPCSQESVWLQHSVETAAGVARSAEVTL